MSGDRGAGHAGDSAGEAGRRRQRAVVADEHADGGGEPSRASLEAQVGVVGQDPAAEAVAQARRPSRRP